MRSKVMALSATAVLVGLVALAGCESIGYVKSELSGTAKPEGGSAQAVPMTKAYKTTPVALRQAVLAVLTAQGYLFEEGVGGNIKTEPKVLGDPNKFGFIGAVYSAKLQLRLEGSTVTYRARFDKKSNLTMAEQNVEYPEKENELRGTFFGELDKRLGK